MPWARGMTKPDKWPRLQVEVIELVWVFKFCSLLVLVFKLAPRLAPRLAQRGRLCHCVVFFSWKKMSKHTLDNRRLTIYTLVRQNITIEVLSTNDTCGVKKEPSLPFPSLSYTCMYVRPKEIEKGEIVWSPSKIVVYIELQQIFNKPTIDLYPCSRLNLGEVG